MSEKIFGSVEIETIEKLAKIVAENDLEEITVTNDDETITVKGKRHPLPPLPMTAPMPVPMPMGATVPPVGMAAPGESGLAAPKNEGTVVKAPIVGTYYSAPSPDKAPFVTVGQHVKKGDVLMIIESMKLMNEVQSEFNGTVTEIIAKNGEPVEFDQPIMLIKED